MAELISVITASLPTRGRMLAECVASVAAQTLAPAEHLVAIDYARRGPSATRNALVEAAHGDRIAVLDDDDLMFPVHLERLAAVDADIVYSMCEVAGGGSNPVAAFDAQRLERSSYIPVTALIRAPLLKELRWRPTSECDHGWEDWDLYRRALRAGATFGFVAEPTWTYRFHGGNRTSRGGNAE